MQGTEIAARLESAFLTGLRCSDQEMQAKFFEVKLKFFLRFYVSFCCLLKILKEESQERLIKICKFLTNFDFSCGIRA